PGVPDGSRAEARARRVGVLKDAPPAERALSGRESPGRHHLSPLPVRRDRSLRAHAPPLLPRESPRLSHGLPARAVSRRRRSTLAAALRAARVARRRRAAADRAPGRPGRAAAAPRVAHAAMAAANRALTCWLPHPARRLPAAGAPVP